MELCLISVAGPAHVLAKILVGLTGVAALYAALFLYENEQGKLQNKIENLWIEIDERRSRGEPLALATKGARLIGRALDSILGRHLFSFRMVGMSLCSSLAGFTILEGYSELRYHLNDVSLAIEPSNPLLVPLPMLLFSAAAIVIAIKRSSFIFGTIVLYIPVFLFLGWAGFALIIFGIDNLSFLIETLLPTFVISLLSDVIFIFILRVTLRKLVVTPTAKWLIIAITAQILFSLVFGLIPFEMVPFNPDISAVPDSGFALWISVVSSEIRGFNFLTVFLSLSFIGVLLFLWLHRVVSILFWPVLSRLFYPIVRFSVIKNRKALISISIACFALVSPLFSELLKKASEWLK